MPSATLKRLNTMLRWLVAIQKDRPCRYAGHYYAHAGPDSSPKLLQTCSLSVSVKSSTAMRESCFKACCCSSPRLGRGTRVGVRYCPLLESNRKSGLSVISRNDRSPRVFQNTNHSFDECGVRDKMQFHLHHVSKIKPTGLDAGTKFIELVVTSLQSPSRKVSCPCWPRSRSIMTMST
jgi:hypothetical protein